MADASRLRTKDPQVANRMRVVAISRDTRIHVLLHHRQPASPCARRRVDRFRPARVVPGFAVSLAGVCDLTEAARQRLSDGAVIELLGGTPDERPDRYRAACPTLLLPLGVPQLVVHGTDDVHVPFPFGPRYAAAASAAGDACELVVLPGVDHFALVDPASAAWATVAGHLDRWRW